MEPNLTDEDLKVLLSEEPQEVLDKIWREIRPLPYNKRDEILDSIELRLSEYHFRKMSVPERMEYTEKYLTPILVQLNLQEGFFSDEMSEFRSFKMSYKNPKMSPKYSLEEAEEMFEDSKDTLREKRAKDPFVPKWHIYQVEKEDGTLTLDIVQNRILESIWYCAVYNYNSALYADAYLKENPEGTLEDLEELGLQFQLDEDADLETGVPEETVEKAEHFRQLLNREIDQVVRLIELYGC